MAGQRRSQPGRDAGGCGRGARLALVALTAAAGAGCPFDGPVDPLVIGSRGGGGGTGGGGTGGDVALVGSWRNVIATTTVVIDTRWTFTAGGACSRTVVTTPLAGGLEDTTVRGCTYTLSGTSLSIVFAGSTFVSTFTVSFAGGALLLNGFRFTRIG